MFYDTRKNDHGLPHNPFKAIVAPRPIGWITSMSAKGEINLAPYSFFNGITDKPPIVMFSSEGAEGLRGLRRGDQGVRLQPRDLRPARPDERHLGAAAARRQRDERDRPRSRAVAAGQAAARRGLALRAGMQVAADRAAVATSRASALERYVVFGQAIGVYIDDRFIKNGRLDTAAMRPIARCGYDEYAVVETGVQDDAAARARLRASSTRYAGGTTFTPAVSASSVLRTACSESASRLVSPQR